MLGTEVVLPNPLLPKQIQAFMEAC